MPIAAVPPPIWPLPVRLPPAASQCLRPQGRPGRGASVPRACHHLHPPPPVALCAGGAGAGGRDGHAEVPPVRHAPPTAKEGRLGSPPPATAGASMRQARERGAASRRFPRPAPVHRRPLPSHGATPLPPPRSFTIGHAWVTDYGSPDNEEDFGWGCPLRGCGGSRSGRSCGAPGTRSEALPS